MVNGKIILGTLSITVALVVFFEVLGEIRTGLDYFPILPSFAILSLGILGITVVRSGISRKRKTF